MRFFHNLKRYARLKRLKRIHKIRVAKTMPSYSECKNCGTMLSGMYCHKCGQYALDTKQSFWKFIKQYFDNTFQTDGRALKTLWTMISSPGTLSSEFMKGRIVRYVHPLKLYLFFSIVVFTVIFILLPEKDFEKQIQNSQNTANEQVADSVANSIKNELRANLKYNQYDTSEVFAKVDSATKKLQTQNIASDTLLNSNAKTQKDDSDKTKQMVFYNSFMGAIKTYSPILMMLLMPVYGFFLMLFFKRKCDYKGYIPHFVFATHIHIFIFILSLITSFLVLYEPIRTYALYAAAISLSVYTVVATRQFYKRHWFATIMRSFFAFYLYLFCCLIIIPLVLICIVIFIAKETNTIDAL